VATDKANFPVRTTVTHATSSQAAQENHTTIASAAALSAKNCGRQFDVWEAIMARSRGRTTVPRSGVLVRIASPCCRRQTLNYLTMEQILVRIWTSSFPGTLETTQALVTSLTIQSRHAIITGQWRSSEASLTYALSFRTDCSHYSMSRLRIVAS